MLCERINTKNIMTTRARGLCSRTSGPLVYFPECHAAKRKPTRCVAHGACFRVEVGVANIASWWCLYAVPCSRGKLEVKVLSELNESHKMAKPVRHATPTWISALMPPSHEPTKTRHDHSLGRHISVLSSLFYQSVRYASLGQHCPTFSKFHTNHS